VASGGIPRLTLSMILNHVERSVTAVYDRHSCDAEKRAALDWWDAKLRAILNADILEALERHRLELKRFSLPAKVKSRKKS
jgi:hypothetical protein